MNIIRCYEILGIEPGSSIEEVKVAYRDLVKVWHPDRFTNDERLKSKSNEKLKEINEAYNNIISFLKYSEKKYQKQKYESEVNKANNETKQYESDKQNEKEGKNEHSFSSFSFSICNFCLFIIIFIIIIIIGSLYLNDSSSLNKTKYSKSNEPIDKEKTFKQDVTKFTPQKKSDEHKQSKKGVVQKNGEINSTYTKPAVPSSLPLGSSPYGAGVWTGNSILKVENGTKEDALVKVTRIRNKNQLIRNFYIPSGSSWTAAKIPPGTYKLKVAFGIDWNKNFRKFNLYDSFSETDIFEISETSELEETEEGYKKRIKYSNVTITLHKVLHGNFSSHQISEDEFNN